MERSEIIKICEGLEIDLQSFENYLDSIYSQGISSEKIQDIFQNFVDLFPIPHKFLLSQISPSYKTSKNFSIV